MSKQGGGEKVKVAIVVVVGVGWVFGGGRDVFLDGIFWAD